jgi:hypothetical protein
MRRYLYVIVGAAVGLALLPAVGFLVLEIAGAGRWVTIPGGALRGFDDWLVRFASSQAYTSVLLAVLAFVAGVGLDWAARRAEGSRTRFYSDLARRLETERDRLVNIQRLDAGPDPDDEVVREMTLAYVDQMALQKTLQNLGFKVPWFNWEVGTGMGQYLSIYTGYFSVLAAHIKAGHIREAKAASKRAVNWASGRGPYLGRGVDFQRLY